MHKSSGLIVLAAILALWSSQAWSHNAQGAPDPQEAETIADIRCVIVGLVIASSDPTKQAAATMLGLYYIGRIEGRAPTADLETLIEREAGVMTRADIASEGKRCGAILSAKGQELAKIGKDISEHAKTSPDKLTPPAK
jgi:hypothetical protein